MLARAPHLPKIRNEIYAHLIEDVDTNVGHKTIRLRPRTEFSSHWRRKNPHRGEVYAFNQVCRTTRREFGPLYVAQIAHRIRVDKLLLPKFLNDFILADEVKSNFALKPKKIEIELNYPVGGNPLRLNVLPLLALFLGNEDLQCTFLNKFGPLLEVDTLFRDHAVAWGDAILEDLLEILLYTPSGTTTVVDLVFREDAERAFISDITEKKFRAPNSMHDYLRDLGGMETATWNPRVGVWNVQGRVEFVVSKRSPKSAENRVMRYDKVFQTQYRLIED
ncbi:hypothetical protein OPT61_g3944 [Boeremia exigua]|uniref:Uncharacterized protein n=1 Tax=Boeremia exigua TaxID=749465 RepID=A0ACC2IFX1_9PLEO|nr:hypothetical protein OPT61_g3944 [Boeremia exigua]